MTRAGGITRQGRKGRFRYYDRNDRLITDEPVIARIAGLAIPPAWTDVWIAPWRNAKLQATGVDKAGRRQYVYHPDFRARREQEKYDKLIRFAEHLPTLRQALSDDIDCDCLCYERVCAVAVRLINLGWFRVGTERYAKASRTFGITTLRKRHISIRGGRISFKFRAKHSIQVRAAVVDADVAKTLRALLAVPGDSRLFRYERDGEIYPLDARKLNDYIRQHLGPEFSAKDFIGNTPEVARASYVSPAVIDQYLDGRAIDDFRPRHLRLVRAHDIDLDVEERALLSLLRSARIRSSRKAA